MGAKKQQSLLTSSRIFCCLSFSFRIQLCVCVCGLNGSFLCEDKSCSKFYLNGYGRFDQAARSFATIASISSRVAEGVQAELMNDNRVAIAYPALWKIAAEEVRWIVDLPDHVWGALASVSGCRLEQLKDETISAAHISFHFLWRRVLQPAGELPWRLCRGDIRQNLEELSKQEEKPAEPCTAQLWQLMREHKYPREQLIETVECFAQCPWTTLTAEQQHGSLSALHK